MSPRRPSILTSRPSSRPIARLIGPGPLVVLILLGLVIAQAAFAADPLAEHPPFTLSPAELLAAARPAEAPVRTGDAGDESEDEQDVEILYRATSFTFREDGARTHRQYEVFRIDTAAGAEWWSEVSTDYSPWHQERPVLQARVVTPEGRVHTLDPATISEVSPESDLPDVYQDRRRLRAPLPAIGPGAVVETLVEVVDKAPLFAAGTVHRELLAALAPIRHLTLTLDSPESLELRHVVARPAAAPDRRRPRPAPAHRHPRRRPPPPGVRPARRGAARAPRARPADGRAALPVRRLHHRPLVGRPGPRLLPGGGRADRRLRPRQRGDPRRGPGQPVGADRRAGRLDAALGALHRRQPRRGGDRAAAAGPDPGAALRRLQGQGDPPGGRPARPGRPRLRRPAARRLAGRRRRRAARPRRRRVRPRDRLRPRQPGALDRRDRPLQRARRAADPGPGAPGPRRQPQHRPAGAHAEGERGRQPGRGDPGGHPGRVRLRPRGRDQPDDRRPRPGAARQHGGRDRGADREEPGELRRGHLRHRQRRGDRAHRPRRPERTDDHALRGRRGEVGPDRPHPGRRGDPPLGAARTVAVCSLLGPGRRARRRTPERLRHRRALRNRLALPGAGAHGLRPPRPAGGRDP